MLLTKKSSDAASAHNRLARSVVSMVGRTIGRRDFLKQSGVTLGAGAIAAQLPFNVVKKVEAAGLPSGSKTDRAAHLGLAAGRSARIARLDAQLMRSWKTVSGYARSRYSTLRSIWALIAQRVLPCASMA